MLRTSKDRSMLKSMITMPLTDKAPRKRERKIFLYSAHVIIRHTVPMYNNHICILKLLVPSCYLLVAGGGVLIFPSQ